MSPHNQLTSKDVNFQYTATPIKTGKKTTAVRFDIVEPKKKPSVSLAAPDASKQLVPAPGSEREDFLQRLKDEWNLDHWQLKVVHAYLFSPNEDHNLTRLTGLKAILASIEKKGVQKLGALVWSKLVTDTRCKYLPTLKAKMYPGE